jgi:hypothetical protein
MIFAVSCWGDKPASLLIDARTCRSALRLVARREAKEPVAAAGYRFRAARCGIRCASRAETAIWVDAKLKALRTSPFAPIVALVAEPDGRLLLVAPLFVRTRRAAELRRFLRLRAFLEQKRIPALMSMAQHTSPYSLTALLAVTAWMVLFYDLSLI